MRAVRLTAGILFYLTRSAAFIVIATVAFAACIVLLHKADPGVPVPLQISDNGGFRIFFPFTKKVFLLGDYTSSFLLTNLLTISFYGLFLWLLSGVFQAFKQTKLFTRRGVRRLSHFYIVNFSVPVLFIILVLAAGQGLNDVIRIILLHLVIGVFAFFMAAIFRQGLVLQEEQDLTF